MKLLDEQLQHKARNSSEEASQRKNDHGQENARNTTAVPGEATAILEAGSANTGDSSVLTSRNDQELLDISVPRCSSKISAVPPLTATGTDSVSGKAMPEADLSGSPETNKSMSASFFFIDTTRDSSHHGQIPVQGAPDDTLNELDTDSSEEVILFKGRNHPRRAKFPAAESFDLEELRTEIHVVSGASCPNTTKKTSKSNPPKKAQNRGSAYNNTSKGSRVNRRERSNSRLRCMAKEEDEILADYIANIRQHENEDETVPSSFGRVVNSDSSQIDSPTEENCQVGSGNNVVRGWGVEAATVTSLETWLDDFTAETRMTDAARRNHEGPADEDSPPNSIPPSEDLESESEGDIVAAWSQKQNSARLYSRDPDYTIWDETVKTRRKQRKGKVPQFDLSDSELEAQIQATFKRDRLKKAERKRERQELRALGLLGRRTEAQGLQAKYPDGMTLDQIADELKTFLLGAQSRKVFPYFQILNRNRRCTDCEQFDVATDG